LTAAAIDSPLAVLVNSVLSDHARGLGPAHDLRAPQDGCAGEGLSPADLAKGDRDGTPPFEKPLTPTSITVVCTGNAVRSVIAGAMLSESDIAPLLKITTAGTLAVEDRPMGTFTRKALDTVGLAVTDHLSHQLVEEDVVDADLIIALAGEHVRYLRRWHPEAAPRSATLRRLCRDLSSAKTSLASRLADLRLETVGIETWEDVEDPATGGQESYIRCALELRALVALLIPRLTS
jgi:protein-tyrosine-phosphatase